MTPKKNILKKRTIISISGLIIAGIFIMWPIQKQVTLSAFGRYISEKNIQKSEIYSLNISKEIKLADGGYTIAVKFVSEKELVYEYHYSFMHGYLSLNCIYYNPKNNSIGGEDISIQNNITPLHENYRGTSKNILNYKLKDFFQDILKIK